MSERSSDIEFDFFEEPPTEEAARPERPARRGRRPPVRPPTGVTPLLRLVGLVAFAILVVVLLVFWVQSCRAESERDLYAGYMTDMREVAQSSQGLGQQLDRYLTTRGLRQAELAERIDGLVDQQEQGILRAEEIESPGRLRGQHANAIEALQLRAGGLRLLAQALRQTAGSSDVAAASETLATQMRRLAASDVVWEDLFRGPALQELRRRDLLGIAVPESTFFSDPNLATARGIRPVVQRLRGATTGGVPPGRHGHGLVSVRALPSGTVLDREADNTITQTPDLRFEVTIENSGEHQEVQVPVRLTILQQPQALVRTQRLRTTNAGQRATVTFTEFGALPVGQQTTMRITVGKVPGEENLRNNTAEYRVTFVLTPT